MFSKHMYEASHRKQVCLLAPILDIDYEIQSWTGSWDHPGCSFEFTDENTTSRKGSGMMCDTGEKANGL